MTERSNRASGERTEAVAPSWVRGFEETELHLMTCSFVRPFCLRIEITSSALFTIRTRSGEPTHTGIWLPFCRRRNCMLHHLNFFRGTSFFIVCMLRGNRQMRQYTWSMVDATAFFTTRSIPGIRPSPIPPLPFSASLHPRSRCRPALRLLPEAESFRVTKDCAPSNSRKCAGFPFLCNIVK